MLLRSKSTIGGQDGLVVIGIRIPGDRFEPSKHTEHLAIHPKNGQDKSGHLDDLLLGSLQGEEKFTTMSENSSLEDVQN